MPVPRPPAAPAALRRGTLAFTLAAGTLTAGALTAGALPAGLGAQGPRPAAVGATVRVLAPMPDAPGRAAWRRGRLSAVDSAAVVVDADGRRHTIPRALVQQLEVREHRGRAGRALGFGLLGGVAGAVLGGAIGYRTTKSTGGEDPGLYGAVVGIPLGGFAGFIVGAVTGANTGGRWVPASLQGSATPPAATPPPSTPAPDAP